MNSSEFTLHNSQTTILKRIFKPIKWYWHLIIAIVSLVCAVIFQIFVIKTWTMPEGLLFVLDVAVMYFILFLLIAPMCDRVIKISKARRRGG